jgi:predicted DNA-binding protein (UPF0251 family)
MKRLKEDKNFNIYDLEETYKFDPSIFNQDDDTVRKIKYVIENKLSETERRIILVYTHIGNIRDTASVFKVSPTTIWNQINNIRKKIISMI